MQVVSLSALGHCHVKVAGSDHLTKKRQPCEVVSQNLASTHPDSDVSCNQQFHFRQRLLSDTLRTKFTGVCDWMKVLAPAAFRSYRHGSALV